ncbi:MAG: dipeptidyl peptidase 3 [Bacteroidales bacterium]|nr:dipeptidyl peptidase 3 [Bacteroidales bacterium]MCM1147401.1 dipeptidyl peptidase 3 [Bacteroidales bacterium]MCM1206070.1 dipeptidyl peptidase 3 [Bacillota bacterium]MCM1510099.1 dipeptidyl peptidase 3 [Clostridium sp.]
MERFADIQLLRFNLKDFETLTLRQKRLVYCLSQATLWGRDITFDQHGRHNLKIRKTLEACMPGSEYLKRIWFSSGIHHHYSCQKFFPEFAQEDFAQAVRACPEARLPLENGQTVEELIDELSPVMFSPEIMPQRVNRRQGEDLVATSACNFYDGVTQDEAVAFYENQRQEWIKAHPDVPENECPSFGLNSRLVKKEGELAEDVCRIGGRYSAYIENIVCWLTKAMDFAEDESQKEVISSLTAYYTSGNLEEFDDYSIKWVNQTMPRVDFINGFIEVYGDPIGLKGSWEGIVHYKDVEATHRTELLAANAQWFEDNSPVDSRFKKAVVTGVTANVVCCAMLGGDEYPATAIGINLPNADWIRAKHGSKSITISNITAAYDEASKNSGFREEYILDPKTRELTGKYGHLTDDLHTDLHECLGHGSGRMLPGVSPDMLKSYASTIEEARADLFGLYYMADPKLVEMGLLPDTEAYKAQYYTYMLNGLLTQCVRIPLGEDIQEAHMRNRAIIANWIYARSLLMCRQGYVKESPVELYSEGGKTYMRINDYAVIRTLAGELLAEVQRIKSEGDYEAAMELVETYGVKVDAEIHREIKERYEKLDIAPYKGFINPVLREAVDDAGNVTDITVDYTESYSEQMMRYSKEYSV